MSILDQAFIGQGLRCSGSERAGQCSHLARAATLIFLVVFLLAACLLAPAVHGVVLVFGLAAARVPAAAAAAARAGAAAKEPQKAASPPAPCAAPGNAAASSQSLRQGRVRPRSARIARPRGKDKLYVVARLPCLELLGAQRDGLGGAEHGVDDCVVLEQRAKRRQLGVVLGPRQVTREPRVVLRAKKARFTNQKAMASQGTKAKLSSLLKG